jgi:hypothetical protein
MKISHAEVKTEHAVSYMKQLCRHWAHKFPVEFDDQQGAIQLPKAACVLSASPLALNIRLDMQDDADQAHVENVVAEHLQRFGFRETLVFDWNR